MNKNLFWIKYDSEKNHYIYKLGYNCPMFYRADRHGILPLVRRILTDVNEYLFFQLERRISYQKDELAMLEQQYRNLSQLAARTNPVDVVKTAKDYLYSHTFRIEYAGIAAESQIKQSIAIALDNAAREFEEYETSKSKRNVNSQLQFQFVNA